MPVAIQAPRRIPTHTPTVGSHGWQPAHPRPLLPRTSWIGHAHLPHRRPRPAVALLPHSAVLEPALSAGATAFLPPPLLPPPAPVLEDLPHPVAPPAHAPIRVTPTRGVRPVGMPAIDVTLVAPATHAVPARPSSRRDRRLARNRGSAALPVALGVVGVFGLVAAVLVATVWLSLR